jgi:hypothetical protein
MSPEQPPQDSNVDEGINEVYFDTTDGRYKRVGQAETTCDIYVDVPVLFDVDEKEKYDL